MGGSWKSFFAKDLLPTRDGIPELPCPACARKNELPYAFCDECGAPRVVLGKFRVLGTLSLAVTAFLGTYYFAELMTWPWPIFVLYAMLLLQVALLLVQESRIKTFRFLAWYLLFLGLGGCLAENVHSEGAGLIVLVLRDLPMTINTEPLVFYPIMVGILVVCFLPLYMKWGRLYGWVNAYRVALLAIVAGVASVLIGFRIVGWLESSAIVPSMVEHARDFNNTVRPKYERLLRILAVNVFRVFLFEIFVFSAVRGYSQARLEVYAIDRSRLEKESSFNRSLLLLAQVVRRFSHALEKMVQYLVETSLRLSRQLVQVIFAFFRELAVPVVSLTLAVLLVHALMSLTVAYAESPSMLLLALILCAVASLLVCEMLFLLCKSRYRPSRVLSAHIQIGGWLLPNILVCFLLVSVSLWASGMALNEENSARNLPFRIGPLTIAVGSLLALLVAIVLFRKRSLFTMVRDDLALAPSGSKEAPTFEAAEPVVEDREDVAAEAASEESQALTNNQPPATGYRRRRKNWDLGQKARGGTNATMELFGKLSALFSSLFAGGTVGDRARQKINQATDKLAGKPDALTQLEKTHADLESRVKRLSALNAVRGTLSPETFVTMQQELQTAIDQLAVEREHLRLTVVEIHAQSVAEKTEVERKIIELSRASEETRVLRESGVTQPAQADLKLRQLEAQLKYQTGALKVLEKRVAMTTPWLTGPYEALQPDAGTNPVIQDEAADQH